MSPSFDTQRVIYQHRQTGWVMLAIACVPAVCLGTILALAPATQRNLPHPLSIGLGVITLVAVIGFSSMSLTVTRDYLLARFGIGLFRRTIALDTIVDASVTQTRWYEGWGIHWTRQGMLYNVAGFDAVRLKLADGRTVRFGSDDAVRLVNTIKRAKADRRPRAGST